MSWCDKLASTPGIGVRLSPHFASGDSLIDGLSKTVLAPLTEGKNYEQKFTVEQVSPFGLNFTTNDGFGYQIDHRGMAINFNYRIRAEQSSAGPPTMKLLSRPAPYSKLLPEVADKLVEAVTSLSNSEERTLIRLGVMATTTVSREDVPPGVERLIRYMGRPWSGDLDQMSFNIYAKLADTEKWIDRCGHNLTIPEDLEKVLTFVLDFQRIYKDPAKATAERLKQNCRLVTKDALEYFEKVAEGSLFDEELIHDTAG